eukprot:1151010-Pelagomonas_calceolata.AAC.3
MADAVLPLEFQCATVHNVAWAIESWIQMVVLPVLRASIHVRGLLALLSLVSVRTRFGRKGDAEGAAGLGPGQGVDLPIHSLFEKSGYFPGGYSNQCLWQCVRRDLAGHFGDPGDTKYKSKLVDYVCGGKRLNCLGGKRHNNKVTSHTSLKELLELFTIHTYLSPFALNV